MFMNRQARRAYLMVARIPTDKRSRVLFYYPRPKNALPNSPLETGEFEYRLHAFPGDRNFIMLEHKSTYCRIPLSDILEVWEKNDEVWAVKVSGTLLLEDQRGVPSVAYHPRF